MQPVAFDTYNQDLNSHVTHALRDGNSEGTPALLHSMQVRRLTPEECEALQGFPRSYTQIPWRKKPASECPDGPRYKALGNSWAVPVARWIGERINKVEAWTS
jgi:DNA (cytosine-5)-methyltransferase 1